MAPENLNKIVSTYGRSQWQLHISRFRSLPKTVRKAYVINPGKWKQETFALNPTHTCRVKRKDDPQYRCHTNPSTERQIHIIYIYIYIYVKPKYLLCKRSNKLLQILCVLMAWRQQRQHDTAPPAPTKNPSSNVNSLFHGTYTCRYHVSKTRYPFQIINP